MLGFQIAGYRCQVLLDLHLSLCQCLLTSDLYSLISSNLYAFIQLTLHNAKRISILPDGFVILHPFLS